MKINNSFEYALNYFREQNKTNELLPMHFVAEALQLMAKAYRADKQVFIIGNGGSASTASHMACDLQKSTLLYGQGNASVVIVNPSKADEPILSKLRERFRVISLCDNTEVITAWANDVGYEAVFSEQLKTFANEEDLLIAISASGNSPNIIRAVDTAKIKGLKVIGLTGFSGGKLRELADVPVHVENNDYGIVENVHLTFGHLATKYLVDILK